MPKFYYNKRSKKHWRRTDKGFKITYLGPSRQYSSAENVPRRKAQSSTESRSPKEV